MYLCVIFPFLSLVCLIGLSYLPEKKLGAMADYIGHNFYIKPTYIVALPEYSGPSFARTKSQIENEKNLKENNAKGILSKKSERKLMNAVNWLCSSAKAKHLYSKKHKKIFHFKINFITLTFPLDEKNTVSEKVAKQCLHAFLSYSRKYFYLRNYVWKFERTKKNQLHVHLTTDTFVDYRRLRSQWNRVLEANGLLSHYIEQKGHSNANSTDVHAVHKVKDIAAYIAKYMSKSQTEMPDYKGRIWASNREISEANSCSIFVDKQSDDKGLRVLYSPQTEYKPIMSPPDALGNQREIGEIFFMKEETWRKMQLSIIKETYDAHRFHIRNNIEQMPPEYWDSFVNEFFSKTLKYENKSKVGAQVKPPDKAICRTNEVKSSNGSKYYQSSFEESLA